MPGEGSLIERNGLKNVWIYWLDLNFDLMSCFLVVGGDGVTGQDVTKRRWSLCYYHTMTLTARLLLSMRNCPEAQRCLTSPCSVLIDFLRVVTWPVPAGCCRSITSLWRPQKKRDIIGSQSALKSVSTRLSVYVQEDAYRKHNVCLSMIISEHLSEAFKLYWLQVKSWRL